MLHDKGYLSAITMLPKRECDSGAERMRDGYLGCSHCSIDVSCILYVESLFTVAGAGKARSTAGPFHPVMSHRVFVP
jgi:hypothetical protein